MGKCRMPGCNCNAEETHHIKEQCTADKNNMIDHHHKNKDHNLVPLCTSCHLKVTNGDIIINGWKDTNMGKILEWKNSEAKVISKKKFNESEVNHIIHLRNTNQSLTQADFLKTLELEDNIRLSVSTLKKIISQEY